MIDLKTLSEETRAVLAQWELSQKASLDERKDPSGKPYFWLTGRFENYDEGKTDTDVWALDNNYVSVVPTQFDMTAHHTIKQLEKWKL